MATITIESNADLQAFMDLADEMSRPGIAEQLDSEWVKKNKYMFARVGIFNPITLKDYEKEIERYQQGICPDFRERWFLDKWGNHPVRLNRLTRRVKRNSRINWSITETQSPLYLTPHSVGRYRERTGQFVDADAQCWNIPYIPNSVQKDGEGNMLTNSILPTRYGAWLGYPTICRGDLVEHYKYTRKHGLKIKQDMKKIAQHFYAISFIDYNIMSPAQERICDAYNSGDYETYETLNKENQLRYPSTIFKGENKWQI